MTGGDGDGIGSMPLYTHLDRIERGLAAQGIGPKDRFRPEQLFALDQWHYHGTDAIRDAAAFLQIGPPMPEPTSSTRLRGPICRKAAASRIASVPW